MIPLIADEEVAPPQQPPKKPRWLPVDLVEDLQVDEALDIGPSEQFMEMHGQNQTTE